MINLFLYIKSLFKKKKEDETYKYVSQLELYKKFGEEVLIDSKIPLENVYIKPSCDGPSGAILRAKYNTNPKLNSLQNKKYNYSNIINKNTIYLILPEIVDLYTLCVWIHEIGHYVLKHLDDDQPNYIHEYEAEIYVKTIIRLCPVKKTYKAYHNIDLVYYFKLAQIYVSRFIRNENITAVNSDVTSFLNYEFDYDKNIY